MHSDHNATLIHAMTSDPPLTREEAACLLPLAQAGDESARERIVRGSSRLVCAAARRFARRWRVDIEEAIGVMTWTLFRCMQLFDLTRDLAWSTYLVNALRRASPQGGRVFLSVGPLRQQERIGRLTDIRAAKLAASPAVAAQENDERLHRRAKLEAMLPRLPTLHNQVIRATIDGNEAPQSPLLATMSPKTIGRLRANAICMLRRMAREQAIT